MGETVVLCGEAAASQKGGADALRLDLSGTDANILLKIEDIGRRMVADLSSELTDLLEVAAYVYCADQLVSRGGDAARALGAEWRRTLKLVVPVRNHDLWTSPEVSKNLERLLAFMSDEEICFEFLPAMTPPEAATYFDFSGKEEPSFDAEDVVLFSGGLDSLSGAVDALEREQSRLLLVSHQSSPKVAGHQRQLADELKKRFPGRILHVPVRITKKGARSVETTQRTRSFLFAALAAAVGELSGTNRVRFFENGVVSFNLPIAGQVVGARATRSTHPRVMRDLELFLSALLDRRIAADNPFIWKTKAEVASTLKAAGHGDLAPYSVSCSRVYGMTRLKTHCGRCSQCLDRRFGVIAAGLEDSDPEEMYDVDLLTGPRDAGKDRTMAESFVRHSRELKHMSEPGFVSRFGGAVARAAAGFPYLSADQVMKNAIDLHRRHGEAVVSVLDGGFKRYARELAEGILPDDCLLRIAGGAQGTLDALPIPDAVEQNDKGEEPPDGRDFARTSEIRLALDPSSRAVLIAGLAPIKGDAAYSLMERLIEAHDEDGRARLAPENYRFIRARQLMQLLDINDVTLRRRVTRLRHKIADLCQERWGLVLAGDAVVESVKWRGYRLKPAVRVLAPDQID